MIAVIDYDAGNLKSVEKALCYLGETPVFTRQESVILEADHIILPGVGAYGDAMRQLKAFGLVDVVRKAAGSGKPFLGICLGMQLLFEGSEETPGVEGLGILPGEIRRIPDEGGRKVPHMGWNSLSIKPDSRLFHHIPQDSYVYFIHSYYLKAADLGVVSATAEYGVTIHAAVEQGQVCGCQFHPEKSSDVGLSILKNFIEMK